MCGNEPSLYTPCVEAQVTYMEGSLTKDGCFPCPFRDQVLIMEDRQYQRKEFSNFRIIYCEESHMMAEIGTDISMGVVHGVFWPVWLRKAFI